MGEEFTRGGICAATVHEQVAAEWLASLVVSVSLAAAVQADDLPTLNTATAERVGVPPCADCQSAPTALRGGGALPQAL
jgi:hypothetical protein